MCKTRTVKCTVCGGSGKLPSRKLDDPEVICGGCGGSGQKETIVELV